MLALYDTRNPIRLVIMLAGALVIALALMSYFTAMPVVTLVEWLKRVFSLGFLVIYLGLVSVGIYAATQIGQSKTAEYWHEVGQQMGNGIATLALTFTLLGISLGIGSLSENSLSPDNIQQVISELTQQFSTAFMTSIVGLPTAAIIRGWASIRFCAVQQTNSTRKN
ncbi:hypothetical protein QX776_03255 [Alteromonadaceae bacterium BrNp21-10]|nr:hypothetical protein [Alteromonadaceae bacterium BrNp21-10]